MLTEITASIPPAIADAQASPSSTTSMLAEEALRAVSYADGAASLGSQALARFMARSESIASSKIEHIVASGDDYARAAAGNRSNSSATSMVAATEALQNLVSNAGLGGEITLSDILSAHGTLMEHDEFPWDRRWTGRIREEQNWIGGSDHSPRDADHVPPPPDRVEEALRDLLRYANRLDVPAIVQAAIVHAQFESIHPFTDGNGRIGRALIEAVLQRRGVTRNAMVPLASGLFALRTEYFSALNRYRDGDIDGIVKVISRSAIASASESLETFIRMQMFPEEWQRLIDSRAASSALRVAERLLEYPIVTSDDLVELAGGRTATGYSAIALLEDRGIIREVTGRKRDRIWVVSDIVDELEDLDRRIQRRLSAPE